jgi:putative hydrolase
MIRESPTVELILRLDAEYRKKAETGELKKIAPKRNNPDGSAWLPILTTDREGGGLRCCSQILEGHMS